MRDRAPPLCTTFLKTHYKMHQVNFSFNDMTWDELEEFYSGQCACIVIIKVYVYAIAIGLRCQSCDAGFPAKTVVARGAAVLTIAYRSVSV